MVLPFLLMQTQKGYNSRPLSLPLSPLGRGRGWGTNVKQFKTVIWIHSTY